jgi:ribonuclease HII
MRVGLDEVGRGCWAGPLVAGAVCFTTTVPKGLKDSKLMTRIQRASMDTIIREHTVAIGLGWVTPSEIDALGITESVRLAMTRAIEKLSNRDLEIIVDGNFNYLSEHINSKAVIKADMTVPEVSAASIIAKVARDNFMISQAKKYPNYYFEKHVGYGTTAHRAALEKFGVSFLHRKSFKPVQNIAVH